MKNPEKRTENAGNGTQTLTDAEVEKTPETPGKPQNGQNTRSAPPRNKKSLNLAQKIIKIKKHIAPALNVIKPLTEADKAKLEELLAAAPIFKMKPAEMLERARCDVFDKLTAEMNAFGVDWRIASETAAQHDANGSSLYCRTYNLTKSNLTLWVYEAELCIQLLNVDKLGEAENTNLHAVGTSTKSVNDARTNALHNCLLSFFSSRFNVALPAENGAGASSGETPDKTSDAAQNGQNGGQTTQNQQPRKLSPAQLNRLYKKAEAAGVTQADAEQYILSTYKKPDPGDLTREEYDEICKYYDEHRKPAGGKANAQ